MFFPTFFYKSAYSIPYEELYKKGKRAAFFDLDNTLVEHGAPATSEAIELMNRLRDIGYKICFISNNREPRVKEFNEPIGADYMFISGKPKPDAYIKACEITGVTREQAMFVGDQIFTDIWGANNAKIDSFLVKRIAFHEEIQIHIKRIAEIPVVVLFWIFHHKRCFL